MVQIIQLFTALSVLMGMVFISHVLTAELMPSIINLPPKLKALSLTSISELAKTSRILVKIYLSYLHKPFRALVVHILTLTITLITLGIDAAGNLLENRTNRTLIPDPGMVSAN